MSKIKSIASIIEKRILEGKIKNKDDLHKAKLELCREFKLKHFPKNSEILKFVKDKYARKFLIKRPVRSLSGIAVVAVMAKPYKCPGKCIYCPESLIEAEVPKSYTGLEPATMRALMFKFDPYLQVENRLRQLEEIGHSTEKIDLIIMGGTFLAAPKQYQTYFVRECINAIIGRKFRKFSEAKKAAEKSKRRLIGLCIETRPDFCKKEHINRMLHLGATRVELGVQCLDDEVYRKVYRGHTLQDVIEATQLLKDSAFKVCYHLMPGMPFTTPEKELKQYRLLFKDERFQPDMLKIYPCLVVPNTKLYEMWKKGLYKPLDDKKAAKFIAKLKAFVPKYVRIMRIQRDISAKVIAAGVKASNLRQLVQKEMKRMHIKCRCIRCREAGLKAYKENLKNLLDEMEITITKYNASNGKEYFIAAENLSKDVLFGFIRLRIPYEPFRKELSKKSGLVRELHVYSAALPLGKKPSAELLEFQHRGIGKMLLKKAEEIAAEEGMENIRILSGIGVREYYRKLGYKLVGAYMGKKL